MPRFAEVWHSQWIAAPVAVVRSQFADIEQRGYRWAETTPALAIAA